MPDPSMSPEACLCPPSPAAPIQKARIIRLLKKMLGGYSCALIVQGGDSAGSKQRYTAVMRLVHAHTLDKNPCHMNDQCM